MQIPFNLWNTIKCPQNEIRSKNYWPTNWMQTIYENAHCSSVEHFYVVMSSFICFWHVFFCWLKYEIISLNWNFCHSPVFTRNLATNQTICIFTLFCQFHLLPSKMLLENWMRGKLINVRVLNSKNELLIAHESVQKKVDHLLSHWVDGKLHCFSTEHKLRVHRPDLLFNGKCQYQNQSFYIFINYRRWNLKWNRV